MLARSLGRESNRGSRRTWPREVLALASVLPHPPAPACSREEGQGAARAAAYIQGGTYFSYPGRDVLFLIQIEGKDPIPVQRRPAPRHKNAPAWAREENQGPALSIYI